MQYYSLVSVVDGGRIWFLGWVDLKGDGAKLSAERLCGERDNRLSTKPPCGQ